jgi:hypothetical protein
MKYDAYLLASSSLRPAFIKASFIKLLQEIFFGGTVSPRILG